MDIVVTAIKKAAGSYSHTNCDDAMDTNKTWTTLVIDFYDFYDFGLHSKIF